MLLWLRPLISSSLEVLAHLRVLDLVDVVEAALARRVRHASPRVLLVSAKYSLTRWLSSFSALA
jgi:hypothetical protein